MGIVAGIMVLGLVTGTKGETLAVPEQGAYTGAYIDFGDTEDNVTRAAIDKFQEMVGKPQAIVASSSYWGRGTFPSENVRIIAEYGAVPLIYWSPWGPPYEQGKHVDPGAFSLRHIVAGDCDAYIDRWGAAAKLYGKPLLVSFGCEPNSNWFPWSGYANGGDAKAPDGGFAGPEMYKAAYRHVVDRVRGAGAGNVRWVFQANDDSHPDMKWNAMAEYYPGTNYVDWLGMSTYGQLTPGKDDWTDWEEAMDKPYQRLCAIDPDKPVMLAEWGVGEFPESGDKAEFIRDAFAGLNGGKYPRIKAAVFWHERWQNGDESWSNLRVNSSPGAVKAYRQGVGNAFWLGRPEEK